MKPIKEISGEILLYFYAIYRKDANKLKNANLFFRYPDFELENKDTIIKKFNQSKKYSNQDLFNALIYLGDKKFINFQKGRYMDGREQIVAIKLTSSGIDIIEGIERGKKERERINITFNFNITNETTVESLLKANFGSLFKTSIL